MGLRLFTTPPRTNGWRSGPIVRVIRTCVLVRFYRDNNFKGIGRRGVAKHRYASMNLYRNPSVALVETCLSRSS